ncbi:hypothetical protein C9374_008240 [Naegleria lovaniensis]|uniref:Alpha/beta hydrolase fold-3 domain-containing protein n=1 Tax=Naegleria lovaniensis TaxID=51637 RepID=A0AA88GK05_NAELO|nr:uncharacterized protein C9374_008240 [Naegleria lovaniensis]KAG2378601.1 hypothetical protein C9374_008240 [Naegleria lovaniensis]
MKSLFIILAFLLVVGLVINYNTKYSTHVFLTRAFFHALLLRNKYLGMKVGDPESSMIGTTTTDWKEVSLEAQTLYNMVRFVRSRLHMSDEEIRDTAYHALAPPVSLHNSLSFEHVPEIRNSIFVTLRDRFYIEHFFGKDRRGKVILLLHGGCGFAGQYDGQELRSIVEHMQQRFNSTLTHILSVDYRLMGLTEAERQKKDVFASKFSDQVDDVIQAYHWLLTKFKPEDIVIVGSSFGSTLSAEFIRRAANEHLPMPKAAVLMGGVYDLSMKLTRSNKNSRNNIMLSDQLIGIMHRLYKDEESPLFTWKSSVNKAVFSTKLYLVYSKDEELSKDNEVFIQLLMDLGHPSVKVSADNMMIHVHPIFEYYFPEAKAAMSKILDFIDSQQ